MEEETTIKKSQEQFPNATPRPWLREVHDARGDDARIVIVSRHPKFETGHYVVCADEMYVRRDQAIVDYGLIVAAVNSYDALREAAEAALKYIEVGPYLTAHGVELAERLRAALALATNTTQEVE